MNKRDLSNAIYDTYCENGVAAACELANKYKAIEYEHCTECDAPMPTIKGDHNCLICGQETCELLHQELETENI